MNVVIRERRLRWPIATEVDDKLAGARIESVGRRAKYLLLNTGDSGSAIIHLGMSGSVFIVERDTPAGVHDHFDIELASGKALRFRDPRRFGSLHWATDPLAAQAAARPGPRATGRRVLRRLLVGSIARPARRHQAVHYECQCRGRRWQHLCERVAVSGGYQPAPRRRTHSENAL